MQFGPPSLSTNIMKTKYFSAILNRFLFRLALSITFTSSVIAQSAPQEEEPELPEEKSESKFRDPKDDAFDISGFLDEAAGFMPIVQPITEPAVGYGVALALMFLDRPEGGGEAGFARPNITIVGGMLTENGTNGYLLADMRHWRQDRIKTGIIGFQGDLNLKFYGVGDIPALEDVPLAYTWSPTGARTSMDYRLSEKSNWWVGVAYQYSETDISFDLPINLPPALIPDVSSLTNAALSPTLTYDTRNTIFTPSKGSYLSLEVDFFDPAFGSDRSYQTGEFAGITYLPFADRFTLGLRVDGKGSSGPVPFYMKPGISLRGVPAMSYQGDYVGQFEAELRWQVWDRNSLIMFSGAGIAWSNQSNGHSERKAVTVGVGWRYELARIYGLHAGFDVAFGPEDPAFYVTIGSAWARP